MEQTYQLFLEKFLAPVLVHWHWSLYIWDFEGEKVVVVDPKSRRIEGSNLEDKHKSSLPQKHYEGTVARGIPMGAR